VLEDQVHSLVHAGPDHHQVWIPQEPLDRIHISIAGSARDLHRVVHDGSRRIGCVFVREVLNMAAGLLDASLPRSKAARGDWVRKPTRPAVRDRACVGLPKRSRRMGQRALINYMLINSKNNEMLAGAHCLLPNCSSSNYANWGESV
jgi:hypothetical protein